MPPADPLTWARQVQSHEAFAALLELVKRGDRRFVAILAGLKKAGHVSDDDRLLHVWQNGGWVGL